MGPINLSAVEEEAYHERQVESCGNSLIVWAEGYSILGATRFLTLLVRRNHLFWALEMRSTLRYQRVQY
jgi:hypothetical protein